MTKKKIVVGLVLAGVVCLVGSVANDFIRNSRVKLMPAPPHGIDHPVYDDLRDAHNGLAVDWGNLRELLPDIDDFGMTPLLRIVYRYSDRIDPENFDLIHKRILGFRYWMDQPGEDSRCYWSENHQILFAAAEYLAGQKFADEVFTIDGRTGREHMAAARQRILTWLEQRWRYGFAEWYSNVYYVFDVGPLCNLIDLCDDAEIVAKSRIILDLLFYDVATQSHNGTFVSTMGRAYENNRKSGEAGNSMRGIIQNVWGFDLPVSDGGGMTGAFIFRERYQVPKVIEALGRDTAPAVIKASQGLDLRELAAAQQGQNEDARIMLQWGLEAFSNPEVVEDTMRYIERHNLFGNGFLKDLRWLNIAVLRKTGMVARLSRWLDPVENGTPLQRANTYTYRTADYLLASVQRHHPGILNDQHNVWSATLSDKVSVFTGHPPKRVEHKQPTREKSPYWVGPGRFPDAAQHENVCLLIYRIPEKASMGEKGVNRFTHAYFPKDKFDRVKLKGARIYGQQGNAYIALLGTSPLAYREETDDDLIQQGSETCWICELGSATTDGSFDAFMQRVEKNPVAYQDGTLTYATGDRRLELHYDGQFLVNGTAQDTDFPRHQSPYANTPRDPKTITIQHAGQRLFLDFKNAVRREETVH